MRVRVSPISDQFFSGKITSVSASQSVGRGGLASSFELSPNMKAAGKYA
jgi:hypothetical protein